MNMKELLILCILKDNDAHGLASAMTARELLNSDESLDIKENTLYKMAVGLCKQGFVSNGLKNGRQATFYITSVGIKKIGECR